MDHLGNISFTINSWIIIMLLRIRGAKRVHTPLHWTVVLSDKFLRVIFDWWMPLATMTLNRSHLEHVSIRWSYTFSFTTWLYVSSVWTLNKHHRRQQQQQQEHSCCWEGCAMSLYANMKNIGGLVSEKNRKRSTRLRSWFIWHKKLKSVGYISVTELQV